jgi:hypothetical protein
MQGRKLLKGGNYMRKYGNSFQGIETIVVKVEIKKQLLLKLGIQRT